MSRLCFTSEQSGRQSTIQMNERARVFMGIVTLARLPAAQSRPPVAPVSNLTDLPSDRVPSLARALIQNLLQKQRLWME